MALIDEPLRRFTVEEYFGMLGAGIIDHREVELLEGLLVMRMPESEPHAILAERLNYWLIDHVDRSAARVRTSSVFVVRPDSVPVPDFFVFPHDLPAGEVPEAALLVVEVSLSTLRQDRLRKARIYSRAGIPEYWIVNVEGRCLEVHRHPEGDGDWGSRTIVHPPDVVTPLVAPLPPLDLAALLGGA
jgi:Uma2 family endonuclease